jgi:DNA replication protein DnaC
MLTNPTIETLKSLKLHGLLEALEEQQQTPAMQTLSFEERVSLLVDRERLWRENQRRTRLLRGARLKVSQASIEDINYKANRGLDKRQIASLATGEWIRRSQNLLITGATGSGKTWIACALAQQTCRKATQCCTGACRGSSKNYASHMAMVVTSSSSRQSRKRRCLCWMTGV